MNLRSVHNTVMHFVSLGQPAGVERHFVDFVNAASNYQHCVLASGAPIHDYIAKTLNDHACIRHEKKYALIKLPAALRSWNCKRIIRECQPDVTIIWNRPVRSSAFIAALGNRPWLFWEHGAAWHLDEKSKRADFYSKAPHFIANSNAARRVLQLLWSVQSPIDVCVNALRPSLQQHAIEPKELPQSRPLRIGIAARLVALKGCSLVFYALAQIKKRGLDVELHIAGQGGMRDSLVTLAVALGIAANVHWHGLVGNMQEFYRMIDVLVHPALHEPFGLVGIEAAAIGCPVITANVDGLPEAVPHNENGFCLLPTLPLRDYPQWGGSDKGVPPLVYDPISDALQEPKFVDPQQIADCLLLIARSPQEYKRLSANGIASIEKRYDFSKHVNSVMQIVECVAQKNM